MRGGVEVRRQLVIDAAHNALLVAVAMLLTALIFGGHGVIMSGGLPPVKSHAIVVASHQGRRVGMNAKREQAEGLALVAKLNNESLRQY